MIEVLAQLIEDYNQMAAKLEKTKTRTAGKMNQDLIQKEINSINRKNDSLRKLIKQKLEAIGLKTINAPQ